ncbi:MAG: HigA family addiction module antitoxin [Gammaproteobacteria bacterium]|jgi:addiction module HigA family antidote
MNRKPTHPGEILREDVIPAMGSNVSKFARGIKVTRQTLHGILSEQKSVTPNIALRLGKYLGNSPDVWLRMQEAYDLYVESQNIAAVLEEIEFHEKSAA